MGKDKHTERLRKLLLEDPLHQVKEDQDALEAILLRRMDTVSSSLENRIEGVTLDVSSRFARMKLSNHEKFELLNRGQAAHQKSLDDLFTLVERLNRDQEQQADTLVAMKEHFLQALKASDKVHTEATAQLAQALKEAQERLDNERIAAEERLKEALKAQGREHAEVLEALRSDHDQALEDQHRSHQESLEDLRRDHDEALSQQEERLNELTQALEDLSSQMQTRLQDESSRWHGALKEEGQTRHREVTALDGAMVQGQQKMRRELSGLFAAVATQLHANVEQSGNHPSPVSAQEESGVDGSGISGSDRGGPQGGISDSGGAGDER